MNSIKEDRLERDMTQVQYSKLFGVSQHCVSLWESNKRQPNRQMLLLMTFTTDEIFDAREVVVGAVYNFKGVDGEGIIW